MRCQYSKEKHRVSGIGARGFEVFGFVQVGAFAGWRDRGRIVRATRPVGSRPRVSKPTTQNLQTQERVVPLPDEPRDGEEPEGDDGRVGREDLAQVLGGLAGIYDGDALVGGEARPLEALLGGVVKDHGADGLELAVPDPLGRVVEVAGKAFGSLDEEVVAGLLPTEVAVGRLVGGRGGSTVR